MTPEKAPELTVRTLMALRKETDVVRIIADKVKEMGPADHIRTTHEVKAFVGAGDERLCNCARPTAPRPAADVTPDRWAPA